MLHIAHDERKRVRTLRKTGTSKGLMEGSVPRAEVGVEGGNNAMETSPRPIANAAATRENGVARPYQAAHDL